MQVLAWRHVQYTRWLGVETFSWEVFRFAFSSLSLTTPNHVLIVWPAPDRDPEGLLHQRAAVCHAQAGQDEQPLRLRQLRVETLRCELWLVLLGKRSTLLHRY